jgi:hypothetical protein
MTIGAAPNTLKSQVSHRAWARRPLPATNLQYAALDVAFLVGPRPAPARPAPPARPPAALPYVSAAFLFRDAQTRANAVLAPPLHLLLRDVSS